LRYLFAAGVGVRVVFFHQHYRNKQNNTYMKTFRNIFLLAGMLFFTFTGWSQEKEVRKLNSFDAISVTGDIELVLVKGSEEQAEIFAEGIPADKLTLRVVRGELVLKLLNAIFYKGEHLKVVVTYKELREIRALAGASVRSEDTIKSDQLYLKSGSGANVTVAVKVNSLDVGATEGGVVSVKGSADKQDVAANTGGNYEGFELTCKRAYVRAGTGGVAEVTAEEELDATANTGGEIIYKGNPGKLQTKTLISGTIRKY
ncbi:MAG: DUF2807 domain-containing protein, partial [Saprospiraceae bacterium]|nr:DUF2807 domain-containing protein [Saprospiraceae bacterium]